jgi:hypothetical protein
MEHLARFAEQLRYAVRRLASNSGTPSQKLLDMYNDTGFKHICQDDLPYDSLKKDYLTITNSLSKTREPMSNEQALKVIGQICSLSSAISYLLGKQSA